MKVKIESNYLKGNVNCKEGDIIKILNEGKYTNIKSPDGTTKKVLQFNVEQENGDNKILTINVASQKILMEKLGDDTTNWIDVPLKISLVQVMAFGKLSYSIILNPDEPEEKPVKVKKVKDEEIPIVEEE